MVQLPCVTWNLTRHVRTFKEADTIVISISKSGRTWLRTLLLKYFSLCQPDRYADAQQEELNSHGIYYTHELFEHRNNANLWEKIRGRYILPPGVFRTKKIVYLYRDPRDVVVSYYHQKTKRSDRKLSISLSEFIRHPVYGVDSIIYVMNRWKKRFAGQDNCHLLSYEDLRRDTPAILAGVIDFITGGDRSDTCMAQAIEYADFRNMQERERKGLTTSSELRPGDPTDIDSYKVRKGIVGNYREELGPGDQDYVNRALSRLDPFYSYR